MTTSTRYLSAAETAKLVRKELKKRFPETKFSVRSSTYSGGASIRIGWIDGPLASDVDSAVAGFKGGGFDGMIDLKYYSDSWLMPDGSACFASNHGGTEGSMGVVPASETAKPHPDAELVSFGADFIFTEREHTPAAWWDAAKKVAEFWGFDPTTSPVSVWVRDYGPKSFRVPLAHGFENDFEVPNAHEFASVLVRRELVRPEIDERLAAVAADAPLLRVI